MPNVLLPAPQPVCPLAWPTGKRPYLSTFSLTFAPMLFFGGVIAAFLHHYFWLLLPLVTGVWYTKKEKYEHSQFSQLKDQLAARTAFPHELWGASERAQLAQALGQMIASEGGWPNDYFVPDDPFSIVIWVPFGEGAEIFILRDRMAKELGLDMNPMAHDLSTLKTFGDFVDLCQKSRNALDENGANSQPNSLHF